MVFESRLNHIAVIQELRDIWDQKTEQTSTLLVLNTLMFGCAFGVLIEGMPPESAHPGWIVAFAFCLATSFVLLFVSIIVALMLQAAMSQYQIRTPGAPDQHSYQCRRRLHLDFYDFYRCRSAAGLRERGVEQGCNVGGGYPPV